LSKKEEEEEVSASLQHNFALVSKTYPARIDHFQTINTSIFCFYFHCMFESSPPRQINVQASVRYAGGGPLWDIVSYTSGPSF
jgi:hypothetical protein